MVYSIGSKLSRVLGIIGVLPGLLVAVGLTSDFFGFGDGSNRVDQRLIPPIAISLLSFVLIVPSIEQRLISRSDNSVVSFVKAILVLVITGLIGLMAMAIILVAVMVAPESKLVLTTSAGALFSLFIIFAVFPGFYAHELRDRVNRDDAAEDQSDGLAVQRASSSVPPHAKQFPKIKKSKFIETTVRYTLSFLIAMILFVLATPIRAIPSYRLMEVVGYAPLVLVSVGVFVMLLLASKAPGRSIGSRIGFVVKKNISYISYGIFPLLVLIVSPLTFATGLVFVSGFVPHKSSDFMELEVVQNYQTATRNCDNPILAHLPDWPAESTYTICAVPEDVRIRLRAGSTLVLKGYQSSVGFLYYDYQVK